MCRSTAAPSLPLRILAAMVAIVAMGAVLWSAGCGQGSDAGLRSVTESAGPDTPADAETAWAGEIDGLDDLDFGQDWANVTVRRQGRGTAALPVDPAAAGAEDGGRPWAILLQTFRQSDPAERRAAAENMVTQLPRVDPRLAGARVVDRNETSMVVYGAFRVPDDDDAQAALEMVRSIEVAGRAVFPRAMMSRTRKAADRSNDPLSLVSVRRKYPDLDPLYSLDVAVWITDEDDSDRDAEAGLAAARAYARQLRAGGVQAFYHHDEDTEITHVTVGLFDRRAIDARSGLLSPEVQALMRKFPERLVNGQPLLEPIAPGNPDAGTTPQRPVLVLVPEL